MRRNATDNYLSNYSAKSVYTKAGYRGITIIEMLVVLLWIACGVVVAVVLRRHIGMVGIPLGFVGGLAVPYGVQKLIFLTIDLWVPEYPICRCNVKKGYEYIGGLKNTKGSLLGFLYRCNNCHRLYLKSFRRFDEILIDGAVIPYLSHRSFGRWKSSLSLPAELVDKERIWPPMSTQ